MLFYVLSINPHHSAFVRASRYAFCVDCCRRVCRAAEESGRGRAHHLPGSARASPAGAAAHHPLGVPTSSERNACGRGGRDGASAVTDKSSTACLALFANKLVFQLSLLGRHRWAT